jgi:mannose-6-phosphate isomerase-like protein (cupin superfamily)
VNRDINAVAAEVRATLASEGLRVVTEDLARPWGGFLVVAQVDAGRFVESFFAHAGERGDTSELGLSPKVLLVAPRHRLSWQYHRRRSEIWTVLDGPVGVIRSQADGHGLLEHLERGAVVRLELGVRHRLVGLDTWGTVAEIWQHTDPTAPSDETDIVRLDDDYGR